MVYQCHKCKKEFIQRTDFRRHLNRKIDCLNIPLEDRVAAKVLNALKTELKNNNITNMNIAAPETKDMQESLEEKIHREQWEKLKLGDIQAKMKEHKIPPLLYKRGIKQGEVHKNRARTIAHCLKWARDFGDRKEETTEIRSSNLKISSEDLKEMIHDIHNFLRNNGIGYGISALKIFNLLYGLKKIEKFNLFDKIKLHKDCKFSSLVKLANDGKNICRVFNTEYLEHLHDSIIQNFLMEELPDHIKEKDLRHLIIEINNLVELEYSTGEQLSGKIYEYFIGRDESAISELGAYFTNRLITDYIYNLVNPQLGPNREVQTMIDPFGGSGGFTGGYIQHLISQNPNWKTGLDNVFHIDMNNDVVKYAGMEFMCLTQEVPVMGQNLRCENSFTFEFDPDKLFKFIFTNPPYGGDKNRKYGKRLQNDKLLNHLKELVKPINVLVDNNKKAAKNPKKFKHVDIPKEQLLLKENYDRQYKQCLDLERKYTKKFEASKVSLANSSNFIRRYAHKHKLTSNDKEGVSLILMMALLAPGGIAVGVLKEGVFFNATYKELRQHLLTHFNVLKVISVPQDQFENTSTKTSIVIFERPKEENYIKPQTTRIEFRKLNVLKYTEDKFEWDEKTNTMSLVESAGELHGLDDPVVANATFEEIKAKDWCLDGKKYNMKKLIPGEGFKMVKLGDIAKFSSRNKKSTKKKLRLVKIGDISNNRIKSYTIVENDSSCKESLICSDGDIVISTVRPKRGKCVLVKNIANLNEYVFSHLGKVIICDKNLFNPYYIFAIIEFFSGWFEEQLCNGSSYPRFNISQLQSLQIPVPIDPEVTKTWVDKISAPYDMARQMETQLKQLETEASDEIRRITEEEPCDEFKLGDLCEIYGNPGGGKTGSIHKYEERAAGMYGYVRAADLSSGSDMPKYYITKSDYDNNYKNSSCIMGTGDILVPTCSKSFLFVTVTDKWDTFAYHGCLRFSKLKNITPKYLTYYMSQDYYLTDLLNKQNGSVIKYSNVSDYSKSVIKIPKDKTLIEALEVKFQQIEQCKETFRNAEEQFKDLVAELGKAALKDSISTQ